MMGMLNNADEIEVDVPDVHLLTPALARWKPESPPPRPPFPTLSTRRKGRPTRILRRDLPSGTGRSRLARFAGRDYTPRAAKRRLPHLHVLPDDSVLVSGDESKSDRTIVSFDNVPSEITALRLEALPDASLPKHGPGRIFYEGPFGDFQLSEFTATVDGESRPLPGGSSVVRLESGRSRGGDRRQSAHLMERERRSGQSARGGLHSR